MIGKKFDELRLTGNLPSPSPIGLRILEITRSDDYDQEELEQTIMADPALSGRILKLANSACNRGSEVIADIPQAARRLGSRTVRTTALGFTLVADNRQGAAKDFDYDLYWSRALATATSVSRLVHCLGGLTAEDAFTCGLLCGIGTLALASVHPVRYSDLVLSEPGAGEQRLAELEMEIFDIDHYEVGAALLADWGLPEEFQLATLLQDRAEVNLDEPRLELLVRCLRAGKVIAGILVPGTQDCEPHQFEHLADVAPSLELEESRLLELCDEIVEDWKDWSAILGLPAENREPISHSFSRWREAGSKGMTGDEEDAASEPPTLPRPSSTTPVGEWVGDVEEQVTGPTRILLIDDDQRMLKLLAHHLRKEGYDITTAESSEEGLDKALRLQPQLVVTDWLMPGMNGLELCRTLRQSKAGRRMYVLIVTAREDDERVVEAFAAGVDDYIVKPFNPRILLARVRAGQRMVRMREQVEAAERVRLRQVAELGIMTRKLRAAAMTDPLTELPNRRYAMKRLKQEWDSATRTGRPLSVILADIDHFKSVNDRFGHDAGDAVLREVAALMRKVGRSGEVLCRIGGEEFLTIDMASTAEEASRGAERLRQAAESLDIQYPGFEGRITISLGVAERTSRMAGIDDLIKAADEALYAAKAQGRNRTVIADPGDGKRLRA